MKHLIKLLFAIIFSILFFEKSTGLNLSIFSLVSVIFLFYYNQKKFKNKKVLACALIYLSTAIFVFINQSNLSIFSNIVSFVTLIGLLSEVKSSLYINWINGVYTTIAGFFHRNIEIDETKSIPETKPKIDILHTVKLITIPLFFVIIFALLYRNGNPIFSDLIDKIDFSFVNFRWLLFTVLGYYIFTNISQPIVVDNATNIDLKTKNILEQKNPLQTELLKKELQLGTILIMLLNILIILFIVTDILTLNNLSTSSASVLSAQVHNGINTLIISIIVAIAIILFFFRANLNFYKENKILKTLTYLWIVLNAVLIILIAIKNINYILGFGLTYKRIGVNIYILLTLIGLISTFFKIYKIKNIAYLFRINTQIAFIILIIASTINWDKTITEFNLNKASNFDINYLINLSDRNSIVLYQSRNTINISEDSNKKIEDKYNTYIQNIKENTWQEIGYEKLIIKKEIDNETRK